jgi:hypothetical protein
VSITKQCADCHAPQAQAYTGSRMQRSGVGCTDCHMPKAAKTAENFGKYVGDIKTHIARISIGPDDKMFTANGKFATGKLTVDFACLACHGSRDMAWALANAKGIHTRGK